MTIEGCAVFGTGPAGLMAADVLSARGLPVSVFEKKSAPGKKLLIAGATGLNVTNACPEGAFVENYLGPKKRFEELFRLFSPDDWLGFLHDLGIKTFPGTSGRHFVEGLKAAPLLKAWMKRLKARGVTFHYGCEWTDFHPLKSGGWKFHFIGGDTFDAAAGCFCLGGGSYERGGAPFRWAEALRAKGIRIIPFAPSNAGFAVAWPEKFLVEAEGQPLKNVTLSSPRGIKRGEVVITRYGLEGTPVYHAGKTGEVTLDLKPDLDARAILSKLMAIKENLSPLRRAKKTLNLSPAALALLFHMTPKDVLADAEKFSLRIKAFPLIFTAQRPLSEAISSSGGVAWEEIGADYGLKNFPGLFVAGEMIDWDAPTGGFLIQACVSQGFAAGGAAAQFLENLKFSVSSPILRPKRASRGPAKRGR